MSTEVAAPHLVINVDRTSLRIIAFGQMIIVADKHALAVHSQLMLRYFDKPQHGIANAIDVRKSQNA